VRALFYSACSTQALTQCVPAESSYGASSVRRSIPVVTQWSTSVNGLPARGEEAETSAGVLPTSYSQRWSEDKEEQEAQSHRDEEYTAAVAAVAAQHAAAGSSGAGADLQRTLSLNRVSSASRSASEEAEEIGADDAWAAKDETSGSEVLQGAIGELEGSGAGDNHSECQQLDGAREDGSSLGGDDGDDLLAAQAALDHSAGAMSLAL
jgi:hypothetical protein